jgi:hypothetical protein
MNAVRHLKPLCAIDMKTTGPTPFYHESYEICVLPLNSNFEQNKDIPPFSIIHAMNRPQNADARLPRKDLIRLVHARPQEVTADIFRQWHKRYFEHEIRLLGFDMPRINGFIYDWLGHPEMMLDNMYIDLISIAQYIDDRKDMRAENPVYGLYNLTRFFNASNIKFEEYDRYCTTRALAISKVYREMLKIFIGI